MQEDIEHRTIAVSISAAKFTGRLLAKALQEANKRIQSEIQSGKTPQGRQTVRKLMNHGVATNSIPLDGDTKIFDRIARKYNVDYAFTKTGPDKYLLFFKAGQADAITSCFAEYSKRILAHKVKRPSIIEQLKKFHEKTQAKPHERTRTKEATRDER